MLKWLKNVIKSAISEVIDETGIKLDTINHAILSKDHPNILYISVGQMPKSKSEVYMKNFLESLKTAYPDYKFILIAK